MTRSEIALAGFSPALSHYTDAVRFGDLLFVSGMVALDAEGRPVGEGDVVAQTEHIFKSIKSILDATGGTFEDVLKMTVFLLDVSDRQVIDEVRKKYFGPAKPASTLIGVKALALPELLVEVEAVVGLKS